MTQPFVQLLGFTTLALAASGCIVEGGDTRATYPNSASTPAANMQANAAVSGSATSGATASADACDPTTANCAPTATRSSLEFDPNAAASQDRLSDGSVVIGIDSESYADTDPSALTDFKPHLDPYGEWVTSDSYGTVWMPNRSVVGADFAPYVSHGHWAYDNEYTWVSDFDWGWAPFHYGRWVYIGEQGWGWIPGRRYAPAWVSWRTGPAGYGYVGWSPMAPTWYWNDGYAVGLARAPGSAYVFCPTSDLFHPSVGGHVVRGPQVAVIGGNTAPYRVPAQPSVNGRVAANPSVAGPAPASLGIPASQFPRAVPSPSIARAAAFGAPRTAAALGGSAPRATMAPHVARAPQGPLYAAPAYAASGARLDAQAEAPRRPSVTLGQAADGQSQPVFRRPDADGYTAAVPRQPAPPPPVYRASVPPIQVPPVYVPPVAVAPVFRQPSYSSDTFVRPSAPPPSYQAPSGPPPAYRTPSYAAPVYRTPSYQAPSGPPPAAVYRSPSFQPSAPAVATPSFNPGASSSPSRAGTYRRR